MDLQSRSERAPRASAHGSTVPQQWRRQIRGDRSPPPISADGLKRKQPLNSNLNINQRSLLHRTTTEEDEINRKNINGGSPNSWCLRERIGFRFSLAWAWALALALPRLSRYDTVPARCCLFGALCRSFFFLFFFSLSSPRSVARRRALSLIKIEINNQSRLGIVK